MEQAIAYLRRCSVGDLDTSYRAVFMPQGLGDILFFLMYVTEYKRVIPEEKVAVVVTKKHFMQLAELFAERIDALCYLDMAEEPAWRSRMVYHYDGIYNCEPQLYLLRAVRHAIGLPETARAYLPPLPRSAGIDRLEQKCELKKGAAVLIAPDAVSCNVEISDEVWCRAADIYSRAGLQVFFNSDQPERFGGYKTLFLSIVDTLNFVMDAGAFMGFRSGLCDVICAFTAVKALITYPNNKQPGLYPAIMGYDIDPNGAYLRYCSLKNIFPDKPIREEIYKDEDAFLQTISDEVREWQKY